MRCISLTTLYLAKKAVQIVAGSTPATLASGVAELQSVRNEPEFMQALDQDLTSSTDAVEELIVEAVAAGLQRQMTALAKSVTGLSFKFTDEDEMLIRGYPIHGHTPHEASAYMHDALKYEVNGVLAGPLTGDSSVQALPQFLGGTVQRFGDRVSAMVQEAYYAGIQLAMRMAAQAVTDAG